MSQIYARMAESADATDLKSVAHKAYGFKSRSGYSFLQRATVPQKQPSPPVKIEFSCVGLSFLVLLFLRCKNGTVHKWGLPSLRSGSSSLCSSVKSRSGYHFLKITASGESSFFCFQCYWGAERTLGHCSLVFLGNSSFFLFSAVEFFC